VNVTATLFGQMITFAVLVWFVSRFLWGPLTRMMADRNQRIADGLAAGEKGKRELELAEQRKQEMLRETKTQAAEILTQAERRAIEIVEEAKGQAKTEADRILSAAKADIGQELNRAKEQLRASVAQLAVAAASKIIEKEIDPKTHAKLLDGVIRQL
jgi:F-type H+-transporting ATPase subunit b